MKILLTFFVLFFSSLLLADEISDFQIEGMSLGDSVLDFFSEKEIKNNLKNYYSDNTYSVTEIYNPTLLKVYDAIQLHFKSSDKEYTIESIAGYLNYENNIDKCYEKKNKIYNDINSLFLDMKKEENDRPHVGDKSGKSFVSEINLYNDDFAIRIICTDWSKQIGYKDNLSVAIEGRDFLDWLSNSAFK